MDLVQLRRSASLVACSLFFAASTQALSPSIGEVKDSRTTGDHFAELEIEVKFIGDELSSYKAVRPRISAVVDDSGRNLLDPKRESTSFEDLTRFGQQSNSVRLKFKNPARKASVISQFKGNFEFYNPSNDPNATVRIANFLSKTGVPVVNSSLSNSGISLTVLTHADVEKQQAADTKKRQEEARKQGVPEEVVKAMSDMMGGFFGSDENSITYELSDPQQRIVSMRVVDAAGKEVDTQSTSWTDTKRTVSYSSKVPADATLELQILTDKSVAMIPVDLSNIALP